MAEPVRAGADKLLARLRTRGFTVEVAQGKLWVRPSRNLTSSERANVQRYRHDLAVLVANPAIDSGLCPHCHKNKSLCAPFGWCQTCCDETWNGVKK